MRSHSSERIEKRQCAFPPSPLPRSRKLCNTRLSAFGMMLSRAEPALWRGLARSPGAGHAGQGRTTLIGKLAHPGPFRRMGGLDPGEKGGDEALSVLALLWVEGVDDQGCDVTSFQT